MLNSFLFVCFLVEGASLADRESSLDLIKLDISRTFPSLFIFQKVTDLISRSFSFHVFIFLHCWMNLAFTHLFSLQGGPYHDLLHSVLGAYTCYRPDIGYVSLPFSSTMKKKNWKQVMSRYTQRKLIILQSQSAVLLHVLLNCRFTFLIFIHLSFQYWCVITQVVVISFEQIHFSFSRQRRNS